MSRPTAIAACVIAAGMAAHAGAATYSFVNITGNNATDAAAGEAQLRVDIDAFGADQALFTFYHDGSTPMTISEVYFDDGHLLGIASLIDRDSTGDAGVDFSQGASPADLPGGESVGFQATAGFLAEADNPAPKWGVSPGESVGIVFDLINGFTFADVIEDMADGALAIGIHVIGFEGGGSESFIAEGEPIPPVTTIPLPGPGALALAGLAPLLTRRRR